LPGELDFQVFIRLATVMTCSLTDSFHVDAHRARAARDRADGGFEIGGGEIGGLGLGDLLELLARDLADLLLVFGVPLPFSMPIALRISTDAGGVFMMKVKLRSEYTVIITGSAGPSRASAWQR
jgi:hypothetical protein